MRAPPHPPRRLPPDEVSEVLFQKGKDAVNAGSLPNLAHAIHPGRGLAQAHLDQLLFFATHSGALPLMELLLSGGANPNSQDPAGDYPAHNAVQNEAMEKLACLLAGGADPNTIGCFGRPALHLALTSNKKPELALELLLAHGARVNDADTSGATPLLYAVARRRPEICARLLAAGADPGPREGPKSAFSNAQSPSADSECFQILMAAIEAKELREAIAPAERVEADRKNAL